MGIPSEINVFGYPACENAVGREEVHVVPCGDLLEVYSRVSLGCPSQYYREGEGDLRAEKIVSAHEFHVLFRYEHMIMMETRRHELLFQRMKARADSLRQLIFQQVCRWRQKRDGRR